MNPMASSSASCLWRLSTSKRGRMTNDDKDHKGGKKDGKDCKDDHKHYDTSCWNAHYDY